MNKLTDCSIKFEAVDGEVVSHIEGSEMAITSACMTILMGLSDQVNKPLMDILTGMVDLVVMAELWDCSTQWQLEKRNSHD
jgi:hypothetical protein